MHNKQTRPLNVCAPIISGTTSNNNAGRRGKTRGPVCAIKYYIYAKAEIIVKITKSTRAQEEMEGEKI